MKCHSSNRHSRTCGAKKKSLRERFFFAGHVVRRCNLSHETFRNTRSKKKQHARVIFWSAPTRRRHHSALTSRIAPRAARAHSLTLLFVEMFYRLGPREKDSTPNKNKTRPVRFFFAPRAARAHSVTLLFVEMFYRLGPREKDSTPNKKKNTSSARFFFCSPRGPGSLTHLFRSSNIINVGNRKRNARGTKKKENGTHTEQKKMRVPVLKP